MKKLGFHCYIEAEDSEKRVTESSTKIVKLPWKFKLYLFI